MKANVLVTGGSGTLGGFVLRELLRAGHSITCFSRTPPAVDEVKFLPGDIANPEQLKEACRGHDALVHLAAVPGPGRATVAEMLQTNVVGTVHVLEAAKHAGIGRVVFASSGAATGFSFPYHRLEPRYLPLDEKHPCEPHDEYGLSKLLAERTCQRYSDAYGIQTICLRINNNWYLNREDALGAIGRGWARSFSSPEQLWEQRYRKTIDDPHGAGDWPVPGPPAPGKILWAFTDARDAAQAFRLAVENETISHGVFLITGYDTCSNEESRTLVARHFPDVPIKSPLSGHESLWSFQQAAEVLGYQPQYTWRESDFADWLAQQTGKNR